MKRKLWKTLEEWDSNTRKKPLIVIGAGQIGKTYIIEEYCKKNIQIIVILIYLEMID